MTDLEPASALASPESARSFVARADNMTDAVMESELLARDAAVREPLERQVRELENVRDCEFGARAALERALRTERDRIASLETQLASAQSLRPIVLWFAQQMESKLRENDHKGGWHECGPKRLLERAWQELGETEAAVASAIDHQSPAVIREAADVANMAMMVADHYREGGPSEDSGRSGFELPPPAAQKEPL